MLANNFAPVMVETEMLETMAGAIGTPRLPLSMVETEMLETSPIFGSMRGLKHH
jgi:hypothetical protein